MGARYCISGRFLEALVLCLITLSSGAAILAAAEVIGRRAKCFPRRL